MQEGCNGAPAADGMVETAVLPDAPLMNAVMPASVPTAMVVAPVPPSRSPAARSDQRPQRQCQTFCTCYSHTSVVHDTSQLGTLFRHK